MAERLRVVIVDDQRLLREGFRKLLELEPDLEVVGMAGDGEEALAIVERLHAERTAPEVVLMDVRMPRLDGIAATRAFKERWPKIRIVILTTFDDRELIQSWSASGSAGLCAQRHHRRAACHGHSRGCTRAGSPASRGCTESLCCLLLCTYRVHSVLSCSLCIRRREQCGAVDRA